MTEPKKPDSTEEVYVFEEFSETDTEEERTKKIVVNGSVLRERKTPLNKMTIEELRYWDLYVDYINVETDEDQERKRRVRNTDFCRNIQTARFFLRCLNTINHEGNKTLHWRQCYRFLRTPTQWKFKRNTILRRMTTFEKEGWIRKIKQPSIHNPYKGGHIPPLYALNLTKEERTTVVDIIRKRFGEGFVKNELKEEHDENQEE